MTDTWPPPSIPMVATPTRPGGSSQQQQQQQQQQQHQHHHHHHQQQQQGASAGVSWHTLHGVSSSSWSARGYGGRSAGVQHHEVGPQPGAPPPPADIASSWGEAAELEALYHTKVAETLHHVEVAKRLRGRLVASRDALAVRRQCVIDNRAAAIASLQRQFTELQNQLLCELRRAVGDVETAEHAAVRPLEAEMDGMVQRVQDIDRLAELTALKIRCEPKHKFIEYARLLQQDLAAATVRAQMRVYCPHQMLSHHSRRVVFLVAYVCHSRFRRYRCRTLLSTPAMRRCGCLRLLWSLSSLGTLLCLPADRTRATPRLRPTQVIPASWRS